MEIEKLKHLCINTSVKPLRISKQVIEKLLDIKEKTEKLYDNKDSDVIYGSNPTLVMLGSDETGLIVRAEVMQQSYGGCYHRAPITSGELAKVVTVLVRRKLKPVALVKIMGLKNIHEAVSNRRGATSTERKHIENWTQMSGDGSDYSNAMSEAPMLSQLVLQEQDNVTYMFCETFVKDVPCFTDWEVA